MKHLAAYGLLLTFAGCATVMAPQDLVAARGAYDRASHGPAAQLDPADLHVAKETLDLAEKSFADNGDTRETRDFAYTAERRTEIAESHARTMQFDQQKATIVAQMNAGQTAALRSTAAALGQANQQIASQGQQIMTEQQRRVEAEKRAAQLREHYGFEKAGVYDPPGVGGTGVIYVLHDATNPEAYGGLPAHPSVPWTVRLWKGPLKILGNLAMLGGLIGVTLHYLRFGPKVVKEMQHRGEKRP